MKRCFSLTWILKQLQRAKGGKKIYIPYLSFCNLYNCHLSCISPLPPSTTSTFLAFIWHKIVIIYKSKILRNYIKPKFRAYLKLQTRQTNGIPQHFILFFIFWCFVVYAEVSKIAFSPHGTPLRMWFLLSLDVIISASNHTTPPCICGGTSRRSHATSSRQSPWCVGRAHFMSRGYPESLTCWTWSRTWSRMGRFSSLHVTVRRQYLCSCIQ